MYSACLANLKDIRQRAERQSNLLSMTFKGMPFASVADAQAHQPLATLYFINAVSILDDALEIYMRVNFPAVDCEKQDTLGKRLTFLGSRSITTNTDVLRSYKNKRNTFAHEVGRYGTWAELWLVLEGIEREIQHLQSANSNQGPGAEEAAQR